MATVTSAGCLLQPPLYPPPSCDPTVVQVNVSLCGLAGVGKTALAHLICSRSPLLRALRSDAAEEEGSTGHGTSTLGLEVSMTHWAVKHRGADGTGKVVLLQLQLWDCGSAARKKFAHLQQQASSCDATVFVMSASDAASHAWALAAVKAPGTAHAVLVVTKCDLACQAQVTRAELAALPSACPGVPVVLVENPPGAEPSKADEAACSLLDHIAEIVLQSGK
eukprot:TRINITY_DN17258_c0_g1_i1.p2 TRINITY_DN17258_c0_g1~~TRINITY_DN17258_c0_g1_i1.p2  ORF type:complete len:247 (-),score=76.01 TRINITY_DN17258_c0_g1_i1:25-690(-)